MTTFLKRKAVAVALGALTLTLAGGGIAAAAQPAPQPPAGASQPRVGHPRSDSQPPVTAADARRARAALAPAALPPAAGTVAWAFVRSDGTLLQHSPNVVSAQRFTCCGSGQYEVILDYPVVDKAYVATIGSDDSTRIPPGGEISVAPRYLTPNGVFVQTRSSSGTPSNRGFYLVVAN